MHGAILVGIQTVLSDDPLLTVRLLQGAQPQPVVLDSRLRFPPEAHLLSRADMKPWIFHSEEEGSAAMREQRLARALRLVRKGARLFPVRRNERGLDLHQVLSTLLSEGIHSLMVEGGARVLESFMSQDLASQAVITVSPLRIEGIQGPRMPGTGFSLRERYGGDEVVWVHFRARSCDLFDGG
jgi:riboflavin biosynthesis pyrimidine reductase